MSVKDLLVILKQVEKRLQKGSGRVGHVEYKWEEVDVEMDGLNSQWTNMGMYEWWKKKEIIESLERSRKSKKSKKSRERKEIKESQRNQRKLRKSKK